MRILYANKLLELSVSDDARIAWLRRSNVSSREGTAKEIDEFFTALGRLPAPTMAIVVDLREAPGRNDDEFERGILPRFNAGLDRFRHRATVVKTEVGRIQAMRIAKEHGGTAAIFADPEAARLAMLAALGSAR